MDILNWILLIAAFCLIPAGVLRLCRKVSVLGKIGPVLILYLIGMIIGNCDLMPEQMPAVQEILSNAMVPLAIPLMLFGCTFRRSATRSQLMALVTGIIAVSVSVIGGFLIFGDKIPDGAKVGGMLTGVYSGGTINLAALKTMLGVADETYIIINSYDILVSFLYLTFLLTLGIKLFRYLLPNHIGKMSKADEKSIREEIRKNEEDPYKGLWSRKGMLQAGSLMGMTLLICAVSGGIALLLPDGMFMTAFILLLTTLGIACSFIRKVRETKYSYDIGMYFIYIFCIVVASMADLSKLDFTTGLPILGYLLTAVFGSLAIQALLARLFRIDADTMVITSVTLINSPPFVPMMAAAMKNKDVLIPGLTIGVVGYAIGNYLGFLMSQLLALL